MLLPRQSTFEPKTKIWIKNEPEKRQLSSLDKEKLATTSPRGKTFGAQIFANSIKFQNFRLHSQIFLMYFGHVKAETHNVARFDCGSSFWIITIVTKIFVTIFVRL